jgi:hypothetical protein
MFNEKYHRQRQGGNHNNVYQASLDERGSDDEQGSIGSSGSDSDTIDNDVDHDSTGSYTNDNGHQRTLNADKQHRYQKGGMLAGPSSDNPHHQHHHTAHHQQEQSQHQHHHHSSSNFLASQSDDDQNSIRTSDSSSLLSASRGESRPRTDSILDLGLPLHVGTHASDHAHARALDVGTLLGHLADHVNLLVSESFAGLEEHDPQGSEYDSLVFT